MLRQHAGLRIGLRWLDWSFQHDKTPHHNAFSIAAWGWGNTDWSAREEFLSTSCKMLRQSSSDALECGSGLSTVIYALALRGRPTRLLALEHDEKWLDRVNNELDRFDSTAVRVVHAPLVSYGEFDWYSLPPEVDSRRFSFIVCDGPPGTIRGGRYGLLPVARNHLETPAHIMLDDSNREGERLVLERWATEFGATWEEHSGGDFALVTITPPAKPRM